MSCGDDEEEVVLEPIINCGGNLLTDKCWSEKDGRTLNFILYDNGESRNFILGGTWECLNGADSLRIFQTAGSVSLTFAITSINDSVMTAFISGRDEIITFQSNGSEECD